MSDTKDTNPKDIVGSTKLDLSLVPSTLDIFACQSFTEGALKYGRYNWRIAGVRMSTYISAIQRHLAKLNNGEWADPATGVPHLSSIIASAGIIADAKLCGKLTDDRPPVAPVSELVDEQIALIAKLKLVFAEHNPHQYTIEDSEHDYERIDQRVLREVPRQPASQETEGGSQPSETGSGEGGLGEEGRREGSGSHPSLIERWQHEQEQYPCD